MKIDRREFATAALSAVPLSILIGGMQTAEG